MLNIGINIDTTNIAFIWLILGFTFLIIELFVYGIGLLFLGIGALINAVLIYNSLVIEHQFISFCLVSLISFTLIWKPLKNFINSGSNIENNFNIIGSEVYVVNNIISSFELGEVIWSSVIMNAKLDVSETRAASIDEKLYVKEIKGNILICSRVKT